MTISDATHALQKELLKLASVIDEAVVEFSEEPVIPIQKEASYTEANRTSLGSLSTIVNEESASSEFLSFCLGTPI